MSKHASTSEQRRRRSRRLLAAILAAGLVIPELALAAEPPIAVAIDRAKVMRISRPADVVIVGNPAIADATIQDAQTLIITGRSFGTTNLIVLDSTGQPIVDEIVSVTTANDDVVTVFKGAKRETLSCTPDCSPMLAIGDRADTFTVVSDQIQAHSTISDAAAGGK